MQCHLDLSDKTSSKVRTDHLWQNTSCQNHFAENLTFRFFRLGTSTYSLFFKYSYTSASSFKTLVEKTRPKVHKASPRADQIVFTSVSERYWNKTIQFKPKHVHVQDTSTSTNTIKKNRKSKNGGKTFFLPNPQQIKNFVQLGTKSIDESEPLQLKYTDYVNNNTILRV